MSHTLWQSERHAPVTTTPWSADVARAAISAIVDDARAACRPGLFWPWHPNDEDEPTPPVAGIYFGAAGNAWAMRHLASEGACALGSPLIADDVERLVAANELALGPDTGGLGGLLLGESGIRFAAWRERPTPDRLDALERSLATAVEHPALEFMWGSPGALVIALALHAATGEARWADLVRRCADELEAAFLETAAGFRLWTQDLYGRRMSMLGAVHGFAGNAFALIRAQSLLPAAQWARLSPALAATLRATALHDGDCANWPPTTVPADSKLLVQLCHGAPGIIVGLAGLEEPIDDLLLAGGETIWRAGPLVKGANLCHGAAGNGYALLKLFERTGDELWLSRARRFAMHAIEQSEADLAEVGRRRYSLWTGDTGLACYLWDCIQGKARFPTMDVL